ncbi:MAG: crossover junction endodeoxyribonuclease RuvC [Actinobacteria bacterium]|nr:MAG: crossover junction endodeoxyribonuclease RuvC [Actinomycetota bacterium]
MFDDLVLGVDPGTASVGLAVVGRGGGRPSVRWAGTLRTPAGLRPEARLRLLHEGVGEAIRLHRPTVMALERLLWGRNTQSAMAVARASGVIMLAASEAGIPAEEYAPLEVKMAVTGVGNASKSDVRRSLDRVLGVSGVPTDPDAADAVAVAVCHLQQSRLRDLVQGAVR